MTGTLKVLGFEISGPHDHIVVAVELPDGSACSMHYASGDNERVSAIADRVREELTRVVELSLLEAVDGMVPDELDTEDIRPCRICDVIGMDNVTMENGRVYCPDHASTSDA